MTADVIVVGAGASGLMAAIFAAQSGASVRILEHKEKAGKKLLLTGNGKCNLSCVDIDPTRYRGSEEGFAIPVLNAYSVDDTLRFFREIGVPVRQKNGGYYPQNEEASGVLRALLLECEKYHVSIDYETGIKRINALRNGFFLETKQGNYECKCCILATGGCSYKETGSDGSGFLYLGDLGHSVQDVVPSLVQLKAKAPFLKETAGIRADCNLTLLVDQLPVAEEAGELQMTDYGVSGICVFQLSRFAATALREQKEVTLSIDFLPASGDVSAVTYLYRRLFASHPAKISALLGGSVHRKLIPALLHICRIRDKAASEATEEEIMRIASTLKAFPLSIVGTKKLNEAQVTAGGVNTLEVFPQTMASRLHEGLFFCGEMLDVDGPCGGYNLQWAWSSGMCAGTEAAKLICP